MDAALLKGLGKRLDGKILTQVEQRAVNRHDRLETARLAGAFLRAMPSGEFKRLAGLTRARAEKLALRFPTGGAVVDLAEALPLICAAALDGAEDLEAADSLSPALERFRLARAQHAELDLAKRREQLVEVAPLQEALDAISSVGRRRVEAIERAGGPAVRREVQGMLDDMRDAIDRWFPDNDEPVSLEKLRAENG